MARATLDQLFHCAPGSSSRQLALVMLPGAEMHAEDFLTQGFVSAIRERDISIDVIMVEASISDYMQQDFGTRLGNDVVAPLLAEGYQQIWLMGISLGAQGAIRFLGEHAGMIEKLVLIAPFLATRGAIAEVMDAGGLDGWLPAPGKIDAEEHELLIWLKENLGSDDSTPEVYVGYGTEDRYADSGRLLAGRLSQERVWCASGGHDWPTWRTLWHDMLDNFQVSFGK